MGLIVYIMIISSCVQCMNLAGYKREKDLKKSDKILFFILPISYLFWLILRNQGVNR